MKFEVTIGRPVFFAKATKTMDGRPYRGFRLKVKIGRPALADSGLGAPTEAGMLRYWGLGDRLGRMRLILSAGLALGLAGCAQVNLNTPEPLQVDVKMKVDVENKGGISAKGEASPLSAAEERRMLSHQVQELKNDRKAGEGKDGLLVLKEMPKDPTYADYARSVIAKENAAREKLFAEKAEVEGKSAPEYAKEFAERAREGSYPGQW